MLYLTKGKTMKFEHTLSPATVKVFRAGVEQLNTLRLEQLRALGLAKEAEMQSAAVQASISNQVAIIEQTEGLPAPVRPYQLSADCTKLIGEVPDTPAAGLPRVPAPVVELAPAIAEPAGQVNGQVNGVDHSAMGADHA
jgi:hypothetical protein